jgi:hypothetical protein
MFLMFPMVVVEFHHKWLSGDSRVNCGVAGVVVVITIPPPNTPQLTRAKPLVVITTTTPNTPQLTRESPLSHLW